jgi:adenylate cyclase
MGLTQRDLANTLGISPQAVSKWERAENAPDIALVPQLAILLGVSTDRLLGTHVLPERTFEATVCMSDIPLFTQRAEKLTPEEVATLVNAHYYQITEVVLAFDGVPIKYIGDSFLFYFAGPEHRLRAVSSAFRAKRVLSENVGIGMSSGPIFLGKLGHPDYARTDIMGETVNLAARMGGWTGKTGSGIAATEYTVDPIRNLLEVGLSETREVKGFARPIAVYEIAGLKPAEA